MRKPVQRMNVKSLLICAALLVSIVLIEVICAYAFVDDFSLNLNAEGSAPAGDEAEEFLLRYEELGVELDPNAVVGMIDESQKTGTPKKYGDIAYKINPAPEFKTGDAEGKLMIENHGDNQHLIKVRFETEDGDTIYQSGFIAPDMHIPSAALDTALEDGEYEVTAVIEAYDVDTQEYIGKLEQPITIKVGK